MRPSSHRFLFLGSRVADRSARVLSSVFSARHMICIFPLISSRVFGLTAPYVFIVQSTTPWRPDPEAAGPESVKQDSRRCVFSISATAAFHWLWPNSRQNIYHNGTDTLRYHRFRQIPHSPPSCPRLSNQNDDTLEPYLNTERVSS
jgi:hypothetical protein